MSRTLYGKSEKPMMAITGTTVTIDIKRLCRRYTKSSPHRTIFFHHERPKNGSLLNNIKLRTDLFKRTRMYLRSSDSKIRSVIW